MVFFTLSHHIQNIKDGFYFYLFFMTKSDLFQLICKCRDITNRLRPMENTATLPLTPFAIMSHNVNRIATDAELTYLKT